MPLVLDGTNGVSGVDGTASNPAIEGTDSNTGIFYPAADTVAIGTGGTERLRVDSAGNAGLGVTPSAWNSSYKSLDINTRGFGIAGASDAGTISINSFLDSGSSWRYKGTSSFRVTRYDQFDGSHFWFTAPSGTAGNAITFTQAMTLDASGNLSVGTTAVNARLTLNTLEAKTVTAQVANFGTATGGSSDFQLVVSRSASGSGAYYALTSIEQNIAYRDLVLQPNGGNLLVGATSTSANPRTAIYGGASTGFIELARTGTALTDVLNFINGNGLVGTIRTTGSSTQYNTSSDYRLKENVQPMTGALAKVGAMKPCTYTWKVDGESGEGFIAHELAEVCPGAVSGEKDAINEDGSIKPQGIDTSFLVATLTAAIQELKAELDATKAEVAALKGNA